MLFDLLDSLGAKTARWNDGGILLWGMTKCKDDFLRLNEGDRLTLEDHGGDFGFYAARLGINQHGRHIEMKMDCEAWTTVITRDTLEDIKNYIDMKKL